MSLLRWFRKNNKKLLAIVTGILMVVFLLPMGMNSLQRGGQQDVVIGKALDARGKVSEVSILDLQLVDEQMRIFRAMGLDSIVALNLEGRSPIAEIAGVSPTTVMLLSQLMFPDPQTGGQLREQLRGYLSQTIEDEAQRLELQNAVERLVGAEAAESARTFLLLDREAKRAGFGASSAQLDAFFALYRQMQAARYPLPPIGRLTRSYGKTEENIKAMLSSFFGVLCYADSVTSPLAVSESQLRHAVIDTLETDKVEGEYVSFRARQFIDEVSEPCQPEVIAHFEHYKDQVPGVITDENPYGFGYRLPDRVQVEYIQVDMGAIRDQVENAFAAMDVIEQEEQLQEFWSSHREDFRVPVRQPEGAESSEPQYRQLPYDEVAGRVKDYYLADETERRTLQILEQARRRSEKVVGRFDEDASREQRAEQAIDYQSLAETLATESIPVRYGRSEFLSETTIQSHPMLAQVVMPVNDTNKPLPEILFSCAPLYKGEVSRFEDPPVGYYEDILPLLTQGYGATESQAGYMMRIIAVDPARVPDSIADDGTAGATPPANALVEDSLLYEQATRNLRELKAYQAAMAAGEAFAQQAAADWDSALASANAALSDDPNAPYQPLTVRTLSETRSQLEQFSQMGQYGQFVDMINTMLDKTAELARERQDDDSASALPTMARPEQRVVIVFKTLSIEPTSRQDYLRYKPLVAQQLSADSQVSLLLRHFDPASVSERCQYVATEPEQQAGADQDDATDDETTG